MIATYEVDVPVWDQWTLVPLLEKSFNGTLGLGDLWAQHNEHRLIFPRLIMIVLARFSHWNTGYELALAVLLAAGIFFGLVFCLKNTFDASLGHKIRWPFIFLSLMVFSLNQVESWLWGWNIQIFMSILAGLGVIILMTRDRLRWRLLVPAALLGAIAAYSYASGLVFLFIGLLAVLFSTSTPKKTRVLYVLFWILTSTAIACSYFYHYRSPSQHPPLASILNSPLQYLKFVVTYLGTALLPADGNPLAAFLAGLAGILLFILTLVMMVGLTQVRIRVLAPYLALSLYSVFTALLTGLGRAGFGIAQAMTSHYVAFSSLFWISLAVIIILLLKMAKSKTRALAGPVRILLTVVLILIGALSAVSSLYSRVSFRERYRRFEPSRQELFSLKNRELLDRIYPHIGEVDWPEMENSVNFLKTKKLSAFRSERP